MDIVLSIKGGRRGAEVLRACLIGLSNIEHDDLYVIGATISGAIPIHPPNSMSDLMVLQYVASASSCSEDFIYMDDHTVMPSAYTPAVASNMGFLPRGKNDQAMMITTLKYLMENDLPTYDYETHLPAVYNKKRLLDLPDLGQCAVRTLYYNHIHPEPPARTRSAHVDIWSHWDDPKGPVVHLSDTALEHKQCRKWLDRAFIGESRYEATGLLQ